MSVARLAHLGHPPVMEDEQLRHARDLLARPANTVTSIAKLLGLDRSQHRAENDPDAQRPLCGMSGR